MNNGNPGLDGVLRGVVRGVAGGIGLASEGISSYKQIRKEKKAQNSNSTTSSPPSQDHLPQGEIYELPDTSTTEGQWELNDAQDELNSHEAPAAPKGKDKEMESHDPKRIMNAFMERYGALPPTFVPGSQIALPVILPQRRPKDRTRGFVRAYAPVLANMSIDQATWLAFLETFQLASEASPWLAAINLASFATMAMPHIAGILVSLAIQQSVKVAENFQSRKRSNAFLDRMNAEFFQPRGLYCLVMTWKPESLSIHEEIDLTSTISTQINTTNPSIRQKFKNSSGTTHGDFEFPEAAPLVFPELETLRDANSEEAVRLRDKMKAGKGFVSSYYDRRAQAKYIGENPDALLANQTEKPKFSSRYADPNHTANSGHLVSLLTGGKINPPSFGAGMLGSRDGTNRGGFGMGSSFRENGGGGGFGRGLGAGRGDGFGGRGMGMRMGGNGNGNGYDDQYYNGPQHQNNGRSGIPGGFGYDRRGGMARDGGLGGQMLGNGTGWGGLPLFGGPGSVLKKLKKDVLYLLVVNMPSEEEMAAAASILNQ